MHMHLPCTQGCACLQASDLFQLKQRPCSIPDSTQDASIPRFINSDFFGGRKTRRVSISESVARFLLQFDEWMEVVQFSGKFILSKREGYRKDRRIRILGIGIILSRWKFRRKTAYPVIFHRSKSKKWVRRTQITIYFVYFTIIRLPRRASKRRICRFLWHAVRLNFLDRTNASNVHVTDAPTEM